MNNSDLQSGDTIYAREDIFNDGSFPGHAGNALLVRSGTRGVIINCGHLEENEHQQIYLVQFEDPDKNNDLGIVVGCWPADIQLACD
ncbi:MAG TPA: nitrogen fixation protein NifZ [Gammaproteobacteria bacterium]|jgi:NifZ domain.|nr:nitrogen fixation protein NifZ [Gammaproteobacteria bacterium]